MRTPDVLLILLALLALGTAALYAAHPGLVEPRTAERLERSRDVVRRYGLTDICLFTEANYTRHPSQADLFAPFQIHPGAWDSFPSGSHVAPPRPVDKSRAVAP